ncbi:protein CoxF [Hyphomicrobium methylovorum]|uniref:protein CoxF n=1 Tax=Hyphomicrobium methylovorum TaxID=84 RepID=UPI0015E7CCA3|nr:protein CoxF [Hyphomicrobium methylovorum]MBA2125836.1 protein CoxF [Hyphomicrobium methylovorum]
MDAPEKTNQDLAAQRSRRRRSIAIGLMLGFMVLAFYIATFVRFTNGVPPKVL